MLKMFIILGLVIMLNPIQTTLYLTALIENVFYYKTINSWMEMADSTDEIPILGPMPSAGLHFADFGHHCFALIY